MTSQLDWIDYSSCGTLRGFAKVPDVFLDRRQPYCSLYAKLSEFNQYQFQVLVPSALTSEAAYIYFVSVVRDYIGTDTSFRVLICLAGGRVIFDSSRRDAPSSLVLPPPIPNPSDNSYINAKVGTIGDNHNTRISILCAQLNPDGIGYEQKLSLTTGNSEVYIALRLGPQFDNQGTFRISNLD